MDRQNSWRYDTEGNEDNSEVSDIRLEAHV